ncbi:MAG: hypothetical protein JRI68_15720, partial [Deltaproteobacteria bacterium]|nr:hypothetical protein [Deltaproteobacteria bacterium]
MNALQVAALPRWQLLGAQQQGGIAADAHEDVVEVVGDATGQRADGLHLLGFSQRALEPAAGRDVQDAHQGDVVVVRRKGCLDQQADPVAVQPPAVELALEHLALGGQRQQKIAKPVEGLGPEDGTPGLEQLVLGLGAENLQDGGVDVP